MSYNLETIRHSLAHVMAQAVLELYPETKFAIGPSIEHGFYYDLDLKEKISEQDLNKIEKRAKKILQRSFKFEHEEISIDEAKKKFADQPYKLDLIDELAQKGETKVSIYTSDKFSDLCKGPHVESSTDLQETAFKLDKIAGAYWKGDENNKMLTRIYALAFESKEDLDNHLKLVAEAEKRDHRKLGKELDLFCFSDLVGPGLPMYTPKGTIMIEELQKHLERISKKYNVDRVMTPHIAKIDLYKKSGHADKFGDELFKVQGHYKQDMVIKPVQCPHQTQIYASNPRSYRDLPIRYMETNKQYRDEKPGEIGGLTRVIAITIDDGHHFCTVDQIKDEAKILISIIKEFYEGFGLWGNHWVSLSLRDYEHPEKYIGDSKDWDKCEEMLQQISDEMQLDAKRIEGEAALYGPKLDFMFKDVLGKEHQLATVQLDFATPKRFDLYYTNQEGEKVHPVMVHRAILGSYERFLAILIEHFAGKFPVWLSPVQVKLVSVSENHIEYCQELAQRLRNQDVRVEIDKSDESVGKKIRNAIKEKVPYMLVIGDKEVKSDKLNIKVRDQEEILEMSEKDFIERIKDEVKE